MPGASDTARHGAALVAVGTVAVLSVGVFLLHDRDQDPAAVRSGLPSASGTVHGAATPAPSSTPRSSGATSEVRITTSQSVYFGRPFETIELSGRCSGTRTLRVQVRQDGAWRTFPLPVAPRASGDFTAYVELGRGEYRLRLVDPSSGTTSPVVRLLLL